MAGVIAPNGIGATSYTITGSQRAVVNLQLDFYLDSIYTLTVTYPTATPGVQVTLVRGASTRELLPGPVNDALTFANRHVAANTSTMGADTTLTCTLTHTGGGGEPMDEPWTIRISAGAAANWTFTQADNNAVNPTVVRLLCDPVASISSVVPPSPREKDLINLTAAPAIAVGTVVGAAPAAFYRWSYTGTIVVSGLPASGPSQLHSFTAPGVYEVKNITLQLETWLEGDAMTPGFVTAITSAPLTITPRDHHLLLVMDRSGSMSGARWDNAVLSARMLAQMYMALRAGVSGGDRIGILVFDDSTCQWRAFWGPDAGIQMAMDFAAAGSGEGIFKMCGQALGSPNACTPIGDALIEGMRRLASLHNPSNPPRYHLVLLTDGYENSGTVYLRSTPAALAAGAQSFASRRGATVGGVDLAPVNNNLSIYPIGLGATVDDEVLNQLSWASTGMPTVYRNVTAVNQLKDAFLQMVSFSQEAQKVESAATPAALEALLLGVDVPDDPGAPVARYLVVEPKANRLVIAVEWSPGANTLEIAKADVGGPYVPLAVTPAVCTHHGFVWIDVASLYEGEALVPQTFWRVVHRVGGVATAIPADKFFAYVDLYVKVDVLFDKREYRTGEEMRITARVREASQPVLGARVFVELARPGESLGTFLATNSHLYRPGKGEPPRGQGDAPPPKEDMLRQLLRAKNLDGLTVPAPPAIFPDGTAELFDDGAHQDGLKGDGDHANVYRRVDKEGVYTWRVFVTGKLSDGSAFTRVLIASTWCGIRPDPVFSPVNVSFGLPAPVGYQAAKVSVVPKDSTGQYLGPFRPDEVRFTTTAGAFQGSLAFDLDGTYHQTLHYRQGEVPVVTIQVNDVTFPPVKVKPAPRENILCRLSRWLARNFCCDE